MNRQPLLAFILIILLSSGGCVNTPTAESKGGLDPVVVNPHQPPPTTSNRDVQPNHPQPMPALKHSELVKPDGTRFNIDQLPKELDAMVDRLGNNIKTGQGPDNFILYVHGRGTEPEKCLAKKHTCSKLQTENNAEVIMFHWQGSDAGGPAGYPHEHAEAAGPDLKVVLETYRQYKENHKDKFNNIRSALIVHSMGSNVFAALMDTYGTNSLGKELFDTIILSSNAIEAKGHEQWLSKVDFTDHLYVTGNEHDPILSGLAKTHFAKRLGQGLKAWTKRNVQLAKKVSYLDFSAIKGLGHQYFVKSGQQGNRYLAEFFSTVLDGRPFGVKSFAGIEEVKPGNGNLIYILKGK